MTDDIVPEQDGKPNIFRRKGHIALWSVDEIAFDADGLRFRFVDKLAGL